MALGIAWLWPVAAFASGPYVVDDPDIADPNTLQNENWLSHTNKQETIAVTDAVYQVLKGTELTLQETHDDDRGDHSDTISPQLKFRLRKIDDNGTVGTAVVVGANYMTDGSRLTGLYAYVPVGVTVGKLDMDANLGWQYTENQSKQAATWGIGTEYHVDERVSFVSELFGQNFDNPGLQLGPRLMIGKTQLDLVYGHNVLGENEDMVTAGVIFNL